MANYNLTQTGAEVQAILNRVAAGYIYMGVADLTTTPYTTNPNVCYLLKAVGTYTNFGNITHSSGIGIALWNGSAWSYQNVPNSSVVDFSRLYGSNAADIYPISIIANAYPKPNGVITTAASNTTNIYNVTNIDRVIVYNDTAAFANYAIFISTDSTFASVTHGVYTYTARGVEQEIKIPSANASLYLAIAIRNTNGYIRIPYLKNTGRNNEMIKNVISAFPNAETAMAYIQQVNGYPNTQYGVMWNTSSTSWKTNIYNVTGLDYVIVKHNCAQSSYGVICANDILLDSKWAVKVISYNTTNGTTNSMLVDVRNCSRLGVYKNYDLGVFDASALATIPQELLDTRVTKAVIPSSYSTIEHCYPQITSKTLYSGNSFNTRVYDLTGVHDVVIMFKGVNTTYYGIAFSDSATTFNSMGEWFYYPSANGITTIKVPQKKPYMAIDNSTTYSVVYGVNNISETTILSARAKNDFYGKTMLYIGDSISTGETYYWKKILREKYGIINLPDASSQLDPANGGIPVIPPTTEPSALTQKSIWYRCAENRMARFVFDYISLNGGTNDMNTANGTITLGTINDTPFVDSLDAFDSAKAATLTATRPATLTFASALMGCIEMLHRDFPTKPIILSTVMPCTGTYGNAEEGGVKLSERMAALQMQIAYKYSGEDTTTYPLCNYGVIGVPLYWSNRTAHSCVAGSMTKDGVHPNMSGALDIVGQFVKYLSLKM